MDRIGGRRRIVGVEGGAERGRESIDRLEVFHADRDAGERSGVVTGDDSGVDRVRLRERSFTVPGDEGVDRRIERLDPIECVLGYLAGRLLTRADTCGDRLDRVGEEVHPANVPLGVVGTRCRTAAGGPARRGRRPSPP